MAKTSTVDIDAIVLDPDNAREHDDANRNAIVASLDRFGAGRSIVLDGNGVVRAGNGTVEAARKAGFEQVLIVEPEPGQIVAVQRSEWSEQEAKGYGVADNRTAELAKWNLPALQDVIDSVPDIDTAAMGFDAKQLETLFQDVTKPKGDPSLAGSGEGAVPEPPAEPTTKPGDVWRLGPHRVICGDSRVVVPSLPRFDCVITDPPYDERTHKGAVHDGGKARDQIKFPPLDVAEAVPMLLGAADRWVVAFCAMEMIAAYRDAAGDAWIRAGFWRKPNATPQFSGDRPATPGDAVAIMHQPGKKHWAGGGHHAFWEYPSEQTDRCHPTQKPVPVIADMIAKFVDGAGPVLDPYAGSGTTLIACSEMGARCVAVELNPAYVDVIVQRWENLTGSHAERVTS